MFAYRKFLYIFLVLSVLLPGCSRFPNTFEKSEEHPQIFPDYTDLTIPVNIAPLNFAIRDSGDDYFVDIASTNGKSIRVHTKGVVDIPLKAWKRLLSENKGEKLFFTIYRKKDGQWTRMQPIENKISVDTIDAYMAYRQSIPGDGLWRYMAIYQRNLTNFDDEPILENETAGGACFSCHVTNKNDPNTVMLHVRRVAGGTIILRNGKVKKVDISTKNRTVIYSSWHPNGQFLAFTTNIPRCPDHNTAIGRTIEVFDRTADVVLFDAETNELSSDTSLITENYVESWPVWSPDGKYLYFCRAPIDPKKFYDYGDVSTIMYSLVRVPFEEKTKSFGAIETVIDAAKINRSISQPEISFDGNFLMFSASDHGTVSPATRVSDLWTIDLRDGKICEQTTVNTPQVETVHTWSLNGRWFLFSSKRGSGLYSRPYISFFDENGIASKPFLVPKQDPYYYQHHLHLYNFPRLMAGPIDPRVFKEGNDLTIEPAVDKLGEAPIDAMSGATQRH